MGQYLNIGQTGSFHIPKTHCSLIILSFETMHFEIKSVLNITKMFYVTIRMPTFIKKKATGDTKKMQIIRRIKEILISEKQENTQKRFTVRSLGR